MKKSTAEESTMEEIGNVQTNQYLTFKLHEEIFGLTIDKVREVLDFTNITKVPKTPPYMRGVINLRGSVVPVIDLHLKFNMPPSSQTVNTCIIIVEVEIDGEITVLGALADSVQEVMEIAPEQIQPPPKIGTGLKTEFIKGMGQQEEEFILLLDVDRIFSAEEMLYVHETSQPAGSAASNF